MSMIGCVGDAGRNHQGENLYPYHKLITDLSIKPDDQVTKVTMVRCICDGIDGYMII